MASSDQHLWRRGDQWYLKLNVPRPLRQHFPSSTGKPKDKIVEPLGDSKEQARLKAARRVAAYEEVFARLRAREVMSPDEIKAAVALDLGAITERIRANMLDSFHRATPRDVAVRYGAPNNWTIDVGGGLKPSPDLFASIAALAEELGVKIEPDSAQWDSIATAITRARNTAYAEAILLASGGSPPASPPMMTAVAPVSVEPTETIGQAAEAWFADMQRDSSAAVKQTTLDGHKLYVRAFVQHCGDIPLASVTRHRG
jgi:hypothetical protein